jgi:hypothetical protein
VLTGTTNQSGARPQRRVELVEQVHRTDGLDQEHPLVLVQLERILHAGP